ncbi:MAG: hypothetical protein HYY20_09745 [Candidatus Tectomicrobia bacterium]|uniref:Quinohemoprotein amine dehydrogenase subunit beta n=1 Tax=Tectimicrobiota bacterium TaxID=2528274 RepID=A0A932CPH4_UNCTE|nr:hypothetical protein [Candidatus Tectomicrobia bacterium]
MRKRASIRPCSLALWGALAFFLSLPGPALAAQELIYITTLPNKLVVIDGEKDEIVREIPLRGTPYYVTATRDGRTVFAITGRREYIEIINAEQGKVVDAITLSQEKEKLKVRFYGLAVSPQGDQLYLNVMASREAMDELVAEPPYVAILDLKTKKVTGTIRVPYGVGALFSLSKGPQIYAFGRDLYTLDPVQRKVVRTTGLASPRIVGEGPMNALPFWTHYPKDGLFGSPYVEGGDPVTHTPKIGLLLFDTVDGRLDKVELGPPFPIFSAVVSPDRRTAYGVFTQLTVVDLKERRVTKAVPLQASYYTLDVSSNGKKLYISGAAPEVVVMDASTFQVLKTIDLPGNTFDLRVIPRE